MTDRPPAKPNQPQPATRRRPAKAKTARRGARANDGGSLSLGDPDQPSRETLGPSALSDWAEEIYTAPADNGRHQDIDAQVIVSTRQRKPRVHLTAPTTVPKIDLERYMGRWFEIARLPYFTQRRCTQDVQADYQLGEDGMVYVTNRCTHADGGIGTAKGIARVVDRNSNSRFEISFRMLYGVHVLWDHYWVIGLGHDYEYALVGQPSRRRGWILARDPAPAEALVHQWLAEFASKGFPAQAFERTRHSQAGSGRSDQP
jgi:apolipoprotein D and lipocalin family protein